MTETAIAQSPPIAPSPHRPAAFYVHATLLTTLIFAAIAPTLRILYFSNGSEGLNVATAQEMHRTGNWLVPTLQGKTRLAKPPLTAWITAFFVSDETMMAISSADPSVREAGFLRLAWETRWPTLVMACIILLMTAELGRLIGGEACGIAALIVAATSLLFLRFIRYSSTDVPLMMWVVLANVFLAHALIGGRRWTGCIGAGMALGLAMMSKGPVALAQTVLPFALWIGWERWNKRQTRWPGMGPVLTGLGLFIIAGTWWFVMVYIQEPRAMGIWWEEITREGATDAPPDHWYNYISLAPLMLPWLLFLAMGFVATMMKRKETAFLSLLLLVVPIVIMSLAKDKPERYLLPMLPAAAIIVALALTALPHPPLVVAGHWIILAGFAIGFPIVAMLQNPPWAPPAIGGLTAIAGTLALCIGLAVYRTGTHRSLLYTTLVVMLGVQVLFVNGYRQTRNGMAELRPLAEKIATGFPTAKVWNGHPTGKRPPPELGVYLNRTLEVPKDPTQIQPTSIPQVLLLRQNRDDPDPSMPSPWQLIGKSPRDKDWWWAYVLPPG